MENLAKIKLSKSEKEEFEEYKKSLLSYVKILNEIDIDERYEKTINIENNTLEQVDVFREDEIKNSLCQSTLFINPSSRKDK